MKALEMALEALTNPSTIAVSHAIELIKQELAKPKQQFYPDWDMLQPFHERIAALEAELAKPEQEPVAYIYNGDLHWCEDVSTNDAAAIEGRGLYTAPLRKEWVGLPDEEINDFDKKLRDNGDYCSLHFAWGISAKLKERNEN